MRKTIKKPSTKLKPVTVSIRKNCEKFWFEFPKISMDEWKTQEQPLEGRCIQSFENLLPGVIPLK